MKLFAVSRLTQNLAYMAFCLLHPLCGFIPGPKLGQIYPGSAGRTFCGELTRRFRRYFSGVDGSWHGDDPDRVRRNAGGRKLRAFDKDPLGSVGLATDDSVDSGYAAID